MEFLRFIFSGFWTFLGCFLLIYIPLEFIKFLFNRTLRHWNIRKHGYPPANCDADGDFKQEE